MNIKRKLGVFFINYGRLIFIIILILAGIIFAVQSLNSYYAKKAIANNTVEEKNNELLVSNSNDKEDKELITKFVATCNNGQVEEAYKMLSSNCKIEKYSSLDIFKNNYYNRIFNINQDMEMELQEDGAYKIIFSDDALLTGGKEKNIKVDYYYIIKELDTDKISINIKNSI